MWIPSIRKPTSAFRPISTNVAGIQISELLPQLAQRMDKIGGGAIHAHQGERSSPGDALCNHRTRTKSRDELSQPRIDRRERNPSWVTGIPRYVLMPQWVKG